MKPIVLYKVCKSFDEKTVLQELSMNIPQGETTALMASSGQGKTTLLRILMGLEQVDSGYISGMEGLQKSAVFQEDRLCENLNPIANIRLTNPSLSYIQILEAMHEMKLFDCEHQAAAELSGGMRRRVAILRALLAEWDILFLDEPFKGLDAETKRQVMAMTCRLCRERTVLLVTHDLSEAKAMAASGLISW
ncbi:MAG TPA: sulfate transporter [Lachnospiraceae bacterium]|jgi:NitT/TauT family transport system ATP-binding protein|uniref:ATP-binding cassette domain-containing protein n=1 Tax=Muricomes intestini TaxID=1796634 RepID=UPI000E9EF505|nr:sulfate transporter [Lachnospiraceae bacterium]